MAPGATRALAGAIRGALLCAALGASASAAAANWDFAPRVEAGYRYSDNYRLGPPGTEIEVSGGEADAQLTMRTVDPRTQIEITPRVQATYFPDEPEDDSVDPMLHASFADVTPRRRMGIQGDFSRQSVTRSELPSGEDGGDLGDPQVGDSGRIIQRNRRTYARIEPFFGYDITQRQRIELNAHYLNADYEKQFDGVQQDFSEAAASVGFGFLYSERSSLRFRGVVSHYETAFDTDAYGGHVEWGTNFSETSRMYIRVGAQQTRPDVGEDDTNPIAGIGGSWSSQRNTLLLDLTRTVAPISAGTVVERHQLRLQIDHDVSPRLALQLGVRASRDEDLDDGGTFATREYAAAEGGFEWRVLRNFAVTATYSYRWQEYEDELSDRSSNAFLIGLVYEPKRLD
jgi:hypothetical protein